MTAIEVVNAAIGAMFGGGDKRQDDDDTPPVAAIDGGSGDTVVFEGREWPRGGAARFDYMTNLATRTQLEGKASIAAAEQALGQARAQANEANRLPAEHHQAVSALLRDQLERDARPVIAQAWAAYANTGSAEALIDLSGALRALRQRELAELGEQSYEVHRALLAAIAPEVRSHTDSVLTISYACVTAALLDKRLVLRESLAALDRAMMVGH